VLATTLSNEATSSQVSNSDLKSLLKQLFSHHGNTPTTFATTPGNNRWYVDSACCNHMTSSSHAFSSLSTNNKTCTIHIADGSLMEISHKGPIFLLTLILSNTYLIPKLNFKLISVRQLCDLGYVLTFSSDGCSMQDPRMGQIVGNGRKIGRLFEVIKLHVAFSSTSTLCAATITPSITFWHKRLGHSSLGKLQCLISQGILGSIKEELFHCSACQEAKQIALPYKYYYLILTNTMTSL